MGTWGWQAVVGVAGGLAVFLAILVPTLVVQSRRYGRINAARLLGAAAVSVFGVALVAYTFLPLPDVADVCRGGGAPLELVPLHSFGDIARDTEGLSITGVLTSRALLQVVFNVALFVPLGVIARRYWGLGVLASTVTGALVSLAIEATQATGIWGLYPCAYRVGDVDDLLANSLGAFLGALLAPVLLWWMPSARELRRSRGVARPVTVWRRWLGMFIDAAFFWLAWMAFVAVIVVAHLLLGIDEPPAPLVIAGLGVLATILVFLVPALTSSGASLGQHVVWLEPSWPDEEDGRAGAGRRLARAMSVGGLWALATVFAGVPSDAGIALQLLAPIAGLLSGLLPAVAAIGVLVTHDRRGLSGVLTGARMVDARARHREPPAVRDAERASRGASAVSTRR